MRQPIVATVRSGATALEAYVVVDTLIAGKAMGGLRMTPGVTRDELTKLARQMTLKLALAGLPIGGAKGGIASDLPYGPRRDQRLRDFGRCAAPLLNGGIYLGSDQGIGYRDRTIIFEAAGYDVAKANGGPVLPCSWEELWERCAEITGFGIAEAISAAVQDRPLDGAPAVAIQGFGTVGRGAAVHLAERGNRVVAVSDRLGTIAHPGGLSVPELVAATDLAGSIDRAALPSDVRCDTDPESLLDVPSDILVLAACADAVREETAHRVRAHLVVEGANHPCTEGALKVLTAGGRQVVPGIVANAGGAIATGLVLTGQAPAAYDAETLAHGLHDEVGRRIRATYRGVRDRAEADAVSLPRAAVLLATERAEPPTPASGRDNVP